MCICRYVYICMCLFLSMYDDFIVVSPALICHYNNHSSVSYLFRNQVSHAPGFPQIHCIAKVNLELMIFLPLLPWYWDYIAYVCPPHQNGTQYFMYGGQVQSPLNTYQEESGLSSSTSHARIYSALIQFSELLIHTFHFHLDFDF